VAKAKYRHPEVPAERASKGDGPGLVAVSTKKEEADFYSRNANGRVTIARGSDAHKARKSQAPQHLSPAAGLTL
jgi:hypothetical protein